MALRMAEGVISSVGQESFHCTAPSCPLCRISSSTCSTPPLPHPAPQYKGRLCPAHPGLTPTAWHQASCQPAVSSCPTPNIAKLMPQPDFRQKPCLSGSPRQMNSEFSMPGKAQYASTHVASHNPLPTTLHPLSQLHLTSGHPDLS